MLALLTALLTTPQRPMLFQDETGRSVAPLSAQKPKVLFFIMAECPIARKYSQEMKRLAKDYPGVEFYAVHADPSAKVAAAKEHRKEFGLTFSALLDPKHQLVKMAGATAVPTAALFDAGNRLQYVGRIDDRFPELGMQRKKPQRHDLRVALDEHLAGKAVSVPRTKAVGCMIPMADSRGL